MYNQFDGWKLFWVNEMGRGEAVDMMKRIVYKPYLCNTMWAFSFNKYNGYRFSGWYGELFGLKFVIVCMFVCEAFYRTWMRRLFVKFLNGWRAVLFCFKIIWNGICVEIE